MESLKYKVIKSAKQYDQYCNILENLVTDNLTNKETEEEIELLAVLIEKWDAEHPFFLDVDPVELLHSLMQEHHLKPTDLAGMLGVSKGLVSDILHYRKGLSKESIRVLSERFKISQEAFNRPYALKNQVNSYRKNAKVMNPPKKLKTAGG